MAQRLSGIYSIFSAGPVYSAFQNLLGADRSRGIIARDIIAAQAGMDVLDVGCGPGDLLGALPEGVRYVGVDLSEDYIAAAKRRFGERGDFRSAAAEDLILDGAKFDRIIASGLLHHLDDDQACALFQTAAQGLTPNGVFISIDPVYVPGQAWSAKWMMDNDRGQHVRDAEGYRSLAARVFPDDAVEQTLRSDLLRVPYNHCILHCSAPSSDAARR